MSQNVNPYRQFTHGAVAGSTACLASHPFELLKSRLQVQGELQQKGSYQQHYTGIKSIVKDVKKIVKVDGYRGLYKGILSAMPYQVLLNGTRLGIDSSLKGSYNPKEQPFLRAGVAAGSGAIGAYLGNPLYVIKTQLQITSSLKVGYQHDMNKINYRKILISELNPLSRSSRAAIVRVSVGSTTQLCCFDGLKVFFENHYEKMGKLEDIKLDKRKYLGYISLPASLLIVFPLVTFMAPFDVIYTRICNMPEGRYSGVIDVGVRTWKKEGLNGFYKGAAVTGVRIGLQSAISMFMMDLLTKYF